MNGIGNRIMPQNVDPKTLREMMRVAEDTYRMAELKAKLKNGDISKAELAEIGLRMALDALSPDRFVLTSQRGNI